MYVSPSPTGYRTRDIGLEAGSWAERSCTDKEAGKVVFKRVKCYGLRNLQDIVREMGEEAGVQTGKGAAGRLVGGRA